MTDKQTSENEIIKNASDRMEKYKRMNLSTREMRRLEILVHDLANEQVNAYRLKGWLKQRESELSEVKASAIDAREHYNRVHDVYLDYCDMLVIVSDLDADAYHMHMLAHHALYALLDDQNYNMSSLLDILDNCQSVSIYDGYDSLDDVYNDCYKDADTIAGDALGYFSYMQSAFVFDYSENGKQCRAVLIAN